MYILFILLGMLTYFQNTNAKSNFNKYLPPLYEDFESYEHFPIPRWRTVNEKVDSASDTVEIVYPHTYVGNHYCHFGSDYTHNASEWLITPPLRVTGSSDTFAFRYRADKLYYPEKFEVRIAMPPSNNIGDFNIIIDTTTYDDTTWAHYTTSLSAYYNKNISIAIHYITNFEYGLGVDNIAGPCVDTTGPGVVMLYPHSHFLQQGQTKDTLKFLITDESGVDTAYIASWYSRLPGQNWATNNADDLQRNGDTFFTVIPGTQDTINIRDSMNIMVVMQAYDSIGNLSNPLLKYNILPTYKWLVVYANSSSRPRNDMAITNALRDLDGELVQPDTVSRDEFAGLPQNLVDSMYKGIIYAGVYLANPVDTLIRNFLNYGVDSTAGDRKHLIAFGDDIGWYANTYGRDSVFFNPYLKARYVQDDASSRTDNDTIKWVSFGQEEFSITSPYPDLVLPYTPDSAIDTINNGDTTYAYINPSSRFLLDINGDSTETPGGLYINELSYIAHYMPFQAADIDSQKDLDTLMSRLMNWPDSNKMPVVCDSGKLIGPDSITVAPGAETDTIYGTASATNNCWAVIRYPAIVAQVGWGPDNSLPWEGGWHWFDAEIIKNVHWEDGNNYCHVIDTFAGTMIAPNTPGHYDYCYRFAKGMQSDTFGPWIYADLNGTTQKGTKTYAYGYNPHEAGDMKVLCNYDIQVDSIEVIGRHWIGDTDTVFVYYTNTGVYEDTFSVFAGENGYVEDSASKLHLSSGARDASKLHVKYTTQGNDMVRGFVRFYSDQDASNDTAEKVIWVYPVGIYYIQGFSGTWPPSGWTVENESSYGWEQATDSISGDPSQLDGVFARFDSWYAASGDTGTMISPYIKMWKEVNIKYYFYYINTDGSDSVFVYHALNGGAYVLDTALGVSSNWRKYDIDIPSLKGTIDSLSLKFIGLSDYGYTNPGVDSVVILDVGQIGVREDKEHIPLALSKPYPNPSVRGFNIRFSVPVKEKIAINIYDTQGRLISRPINGEVESGIHIVKWNGRDRNGRRVPEGIYFIELKTDKKRLLKRGILVR